MSRLSFLDSSRGLAALAVLLSHFQLTILPQYNEHWVSHSPIKLFFDGEAAVLYFFVLSGFVLTHSYKTNNGLTIPGYLRFIGRRIFRIYPVFLLTLFLSYFLIKYISIHPAALFSHFWFALPDFESVIKQAILIIRIPNDPGLRLLPHDWTLSIEMGISMLLPVLALVSKKNPAILLLFAYCAIQFLNVEPFLWDFSLGIFIAQKLVLNELTIKQNRDKILLLALALILICTGYSFPEMMKQTDRVLIHHKSCGLAILLVLLLSSKGSQKLLSTPALTFLGKISYSFYLLHLIVLFLIAAIFPNLGTLPFFIIYLSVTLLSSLFAFYTFEKPFNKLGKSLFSLTKS